MRTRTVVSATKLTRQVLTETPSRALAFLITVGANPAVYARLSAVGYSAEEHREGWTLLNKVVGRKPFGRQPAVTVSTRNEDIARAIATLEEWNHGAFLRIRGGLARLHPKQGAFLFNGLEVSHGADAVPAVATFLDRLDDLESSPERKSTRKADHAALAMIAHRGIGKNERAKVRALVHVAKSSPDLPSTKTPEAIAEEQSEVVELRAWYNDWAATARTVVTNRNLLFRMKVLKRKSRKTAEQPPVAVVPSPIAPPATQEGGAPAMTKSREDAAE